ncbi:MAG: response regulator [Verrucomicrobiota bacterium]
MAYTVLILDDDEDFNSLLTDIFEQADYVVASLTDPIEAVEVFTHTDYDLVVTDHKMPEMTGAEFMRTIKGIKPEVPVVMVSGYLENDMIRELIRDGVGGVFLKPLNIFSLLERTSELIEEAVKLKAAAKTNPDVSKAFEMDSPDAKLGFRFRSFPCKSSASSDFAERLHSFRNFKLALTLIGGPGTHYRQICEDLAGFYEDTADRFAYFSRDSFDESKLRAALETAKADDASRLTCVLLSVEDMSPEQKQLAAILPKAEGPFSGYAYDIRVIYCVSGDLDDLYDEELIDEHLYILMGTAEVRVPRLKDCSSDIVLMAQQLVVQAAQKVGSQNTPRFDKSAREFLRNYDWPTNYAGLTERVDSAVAATQGGVISIDVLRTAEKELVEETISSRYEVLLKDARKELVNSAIIMFGDDASKAAPFFGADTASINSIINK